MIQRIQTVWYLLAILAVMAIFVFPVISHEPVVALAEEVAFSVKQDMWQLASWFLHPVVAILLVVAMITYKRLKQQMQLGTLALIFYGLLLAGWIAESLFATPQIISGELVAHATLLTPGFFIFASGFIFTILGNRGVKKDKKLIDSLNRLR